MINSSVNSSSSNNFLTLFIVQCFDTQLPYTHIYAHALVYMVLIVSANLTMVGSGNWVKLCLVFFEICDDNDVGPGPKELTK